MVKPFDGKWNSDPTFTSRTRGLFLGLALGDSVGSKSGDIPDTGLLEAGAATQLAAWTAEGILRGVTRYNDFASTDPLLVRFAYQRWASFRGIEPDEPHLGWLPFLEMEDEAETALHRGWLADVPAMKELRGSSPTTEAVLLAENQDPAKSAGCQGMLRALTVAPFAHVPKFRKSWWSAEETATMVEDTARHIGLLTHDDGNEQRTTGLAVRILHTCLGSTGDLHSTVKPVVEGIHGGPHRFADAVSAAVHAPCVPDALEELAPDKSSVSALAGGIYVALSFPEVDSVREAIEFAGWAPDGDSVAAVAGAILGSRFGYEALPPEWLHRLELGWTMDRLAVDTATEVQEHQGGPGWREDYPESREVKDPWWSNKYPGC